jgi:SHS2 domain-containing protein
MSGFKFLDHTADVGIEVNGKTVKEILLEAAKGMENILTDFSKIDRCDKKEFEIESDNLDELFFEFLSKLLYYYGAESLVFGEFEIKLKRGKRCRLNVRAYGERYCPGKHRYGEEIKGVSYHDLEVKKVKGGWKASVLFDI